MKKRQNNNLAILVVISICLLLGSGRASTLKVGGFIGGWGYNAPETGIKTQNNIGIYTTVYANSATFSFFGLYEAAGGGFELPLERNIKPYISYLRVNLRGPIFPDVKPITVSIGQGALNFSPYVATFNSSYSTTAQGLSFENFQWNKFDLSGFALIESNRQFKDIGRGFRVRCNDSRLKINVVLAQHLTGNPVLRDRDVETLGPYLVGEKDLHLQVERQFSNGVKLDLLQVTQDKRDLPTSSFKKADLKVPYKKSNLLFSYVNVDSNFLPRYRNKTPKVVSPGFKSFNERIASINLLERYKAQQSFAFNLSGNLKYTPLLDVEYVIHKSNLSPQTRLKAEIGDKTRYRLLSIFEHKENLEAQHLVLGATLPIVKNRDKSLVTYVDFIYDRDGTNNDYGIEGYMRNYGMEATFSQGSFRGLAIDLGIQKAEKNHIYLKGKWSMFRYIDVLFACHFPNVDEGEDWWIDDWNNIVYRDNFLSLKTSVYF